MNKTYYTRKEAADILGVSPQSISNYSAKGLLHEVRRGPSALYPCVEVDALNDAPEFHSRETIEEGIRKMEEESRQMHAQLSERYAQLKEDFRIAITNGHPENWFRYRELFFKVLRLAADETLTDRNAVIMMDILNGNSLQDVADNHGLTRERIRQIYERCLRSIVRFRDIATTRLEHANATIERLKKENEGLKANIWALEHPEFGKPVVEVADELTKFRHTSPFNTPLRQIGLSVRTFNCCHAADIETIGDLCSKTRFQMMKLRNFGRKSLYELDTLLEKMKLEWAMWTDPDYDYIAMRRKEKDA